MKNRRFTQTSVNNFICCGDEYLFIKRSADKKVDAGRLNSIGGKLEPYEDYLTAVIRETEEETGLKITPEDLQFIGVVKLEEGYVDDWVMCFFKTEVKTKFIPHGSKTIDGEFVWIHKDKVLDSEHELVDDLNYLWKDIVEGKHVIFATACLNDKEKIENINISKLRK